MDNTLIFDEVFDKLYSFFKYKKQFVFVPTQSRLSILAACEDPKTLVLTSIQGKSWPLPQTGQMNLEEEILKNPSYKGVFCYTTSYRDEPHPIAGRHDIVFPMVEFESFGDINNLKKLEKELLGYLGFNTPFEISYESACNKYGVDSIEAGQEQRLCEDYGDVVMLEKFPQRTHPFWNMKHIGNGIYNKIDVILWGMETMGSAERSCNVKEMRQNFLTISDGEYAQTLFTKFGEDEVMKELNYYLSLKMVPRFGAGIGVVPRLSRAMEQEGLLKCFNVDKNEN